MIQPCDIIFIYSLLLNSEKTQQDGDQADVSQFFLQFGEQVAAENQTGPVSQSITQIAEQQGVGNTGAVNQAIEQFIQQLATDAGIQHAIVQTAIKQL